MDWTTHDLIRHIASHMSEALPAHQTPLTWHGQYELWTIAQTGDGREIAACIDPAPKAGEVPGSDYTRIVWNVRGSEGWQVSGTFVRFAEAAAREFAELGAVPVMPDRVGKYRVEIDTTLAAIGDEVERSAFLLALQAEIADMVAAHVPEAGAGIAP